MYRRFYILLRKQTLMEKYTYIYLVSGLCHDSHMHTHKHTHVRAHTHKQIYSAKHLGEADRDKERYRGLQHLRSMYSSSICVQFTTTNLPPHPQTPRYMSKLCLFSAEIFAANNSDWLILAATIFLGLL